MTSLAPDGPPSVSVVIPTRNAATQLERCLASLRSESLPMEVIVVDQSSVDGKREVAASAGARVVDLEPPNVHTLGTRSRNVGSALARGEYLLHIDADMSLSRPWFSQAIGLCERGSVAVVLEESDVGSGYWAACKALERRCYHNSPLEAARFIRTSIFRRIGGYNEALGSGEDWDLHARCAAQGSIARIPGALDHRIDRLSYRRQLRKKFVYGRSVPAFAEAYDTPSLTDAMIRSYARSWRSLVADPVHAAGFVGLRAGEAAAMAAGLAYERAHRHRASHTVTSR